MLTQMPMEIISEVKTLDLGEGAIATELVGFLRVVDSFTCCTTWRGTVNSILPYSIVIFMLPCLNEGV